MWDSSRLPAGFCHLPRKAGAVRSGLVKRPAGVPPPLYSAFLTLVVRALLTRLPAPENDPSRFQIVFKFPRMGLRSIDYARNQI
jgi:hypothetical protein